MLCTMVDEKTPFRVKATAAMALLYAISPIDFIPDEIPGLGQIDDLAVIFFTYRQVAGWEQATAWLFSHDIQPKPLMKIGKPLIDLGNILDTEKWATQYYDQESTTPGADQSLGKPLRQRQEKTRCVH